MSANGTVAAVLLKAAELLALQDNVDARRIAELDRQIMALAPQVVKLGHKAVPELSAAALDKKQKPKLRLFTLSFLGLTRDPLALPALDAVLRDKSEPSFLRESAAESIAGLPISARARRGALCAALDVKQALAEAARLGCDEPAVLARVEGLPAVEALGRSQPLEAVRILLARLERADPKSPEAAAILRALARRPDDLRVVGKYGVIWDVLRDSGRSGEAGAAGASLLAELQPDGAREQLVRLLDDKDAGVAVAAAEGLAKLRYEPAAPKIQSIVDSALGDSRFGPRPDAVQLLDRLEKAAASLKNP